LYYCYIATSYFYYIEVALLQLLQLLTTITIITNNQKELYFVLARQVGTNELKAVLVLHRRKSL